MTLFPAWQDRVRKAPAGSISRSTRDGQDVVRERPADLLAAARRSAGESLTLDEYTAARLAVSEHGSGSPEELACIIDAEVNRAEKRGVSLYEHLTGGTDRFGRQRGVRKASTRLDPTMRHVEAARAVLGGDARGIAQGAHRFFDPRTQTYIARTRGAAPPLLVLERWCYDKAWATKNKSLKGGNELAPWGSGVGDGLEEWVGPIDGVNAYELMLFRSATAGADHNQRYLAAREVIRSKSGIGRTLAELAPLGLALVLLAGVVYA